MTLEEEHHGRIADTFEQYRAEQGQDPWIGDESADTGPLRAGLGGRSLRRRNKPEQQENGKQTGRSEDAGSQTPVGERADERSDRRADYQRK